MDIAKIRWVFFIVMAAVLELSMAATYKVGNDEGDTIGYMFSFRSQGVIGYNTKNSLTRIKMTMGRRMLNAVLNDYNDPGPPPHIRQPPHGSVPPSLTLKNIYPPSQKKGAALDDYTDPGANNRHNPPPQKEGADLDYYGPPGANKGHDPPPSQKNSAAVDDYTDPGANRRHDPPQSGRRLRHHWMSIKHAVIHFGGKWCVDEPSGGYEVTDYIGRENDKFKDVNGEYLCYMNLLNAINETVDHKCGKAFCPAGSMLELHCISKGKILVIDSDNALTGVWHNSDKDPTGFIHLFVFIIALAPGTPRVMHGTLERDPNNTANLPRKKTLAKKTIPKNTAVRLGSVVGDANMSQVMGDMTVSQVMGDVTVGSGYVGENVIYKKKARATKKDKRKNIETNGQNQPSVMKKKRLRPSELPEEELDHLPVFHVSDDDDNMAGDNVEVVGEVPIWEEDNADEGGHDDYMGGDDANVGGDNDDEGGHDVDMDSLDVEEGYYSTHSSQDGDVIPNKKDLRIFAILNKFETIQVKNESYRLRYKCAVKKCKWLVYARRSYDGHSMVLKGCHFEHTCTGKVGSENKLANALWIPNKIEELVRDVKTLTPKDVQTTIRRKYGVNVSYYTAWNAKTICIKRISRSFDDGYNRLPELTRQVLSSNPGSIATWSFQYDTKQWTGTCMAFKASLDGFVNGYRPVLGLDGCFLKGKSKYYETWHTIITMLAPHLTRHQSKLTFISDRQKCLIESVTEVFPHQNHRFCFRHMWKNFKKDFWGSHLERLCWGAAKAFVKADKQVFLDKLQVDNPEAKGWLDKEPSEYWCRSHFDFTAKYEHITNNFSESFNNWILKIIDKPLDKVIEGINLMMMKLTYDRRVKAQGWDQNFVVPRAKIHIDRIKRFYNEYAPQVFDFNSWVVISKDGKKWKVNLEERTCDYNEYCSEHHMVSSYVKTYSGSVLAISDLSLWDNTVNIEVLPPPLMRGDGRPRKVRRKCDDEGGSQQKRCHKCVHLGHNKKICKGPLAELRRRGSQPATRVTGGGKPRGNRPRDSFGTRSGVTTELPIQPTVPTPRGRGGRGTNLIGRGNSQNWKK
ncbi:hypothetical protein GIB67_014367 [Kingdonia uniflora]|uniref:Transposase MuDR plant domain-containing protein n=1 Tax=Kingdonia uniflora TaxID=39325 RepID=A0A7J7NTB1_9MAGN|nr:hypothetical protein GIB67_014367 [Kingdonia uniflora]